MRISSRLGCSQSSRARAPSHGRAPGHIGRARSSRPRPPRWSPLLLAALAADRQVAEVAAGALLVEPELLLQPSSSPRWTNRRQSRSAMWPRGQARTNRVGTTSQPVEAPPLVECLARARAAASGCCRLRAALLLHDEPLAGSARRRCPSPSRRASRCPAAARRASAPADPVSSRELLREPLVDDLLQTDRCSARPPGRRRSPDMARQVDQRARPPGRDDLAAADAAVTACSFVVLHEFPVEVSLTKRLTSGSTSRSERLTRNLLLLAVERLVSSMSCSSGFGPVICS